MAINTCCWTSPSKISDLGGLGWGLTVCTTNKFPSDAEDQVPYFKNQ